MASRLQVIWRVASKSVVFYFVFVLAVAKAEIPYQQVLSMGFVGSLGSEPQTRLLAGPDGSLYGTTYRGGNSGRGTVFRINPDGSSFAVLHSFRSNPEDGSYPYSDLVFGREGAIYGTTELGGTNNAGAIFKINTDGSGYRTIYHFATATGSSPRGHLLQGSDGAFYSTTQWGGAASLGTIYKIQQNGVGHTVLHHFGTGVANTGGDCDTGLTLGSDGVLYGVTSIGGDYSHGTLFKIMPDGTGFTTLYNFKGYQFLDGSEPDGRPLELPDGKLYGTTDSGGVGFVGYGTIYRINKDGSGYQILRRMNPTNGDPVGFPSELLRGMDGALYTSASSGVLKMQADGSALELLHSFAGMPTDGRRGRGVVFGAGGALFGITQFGGTNDQGTIFRMNPDGSDYSILHHFRHVAYGPASPRSLLVRSSSGLFYGTSEAGGTMNAGTIFSLTTNGMKTGLLYHFGEGTNAGKIPNALLDGGDGWLYGTTSQGGVSNAGTIFRVRTSDSEFEIMRHFGPSLEPRGPRSRLIAGSGGWLFGTSSTGGTNGRGTIFAINKNTAQLKVLRSFTIAEGSQAQGDLAQTSDGTIFGTAGSGGASNLGTVFSIREDGSDFRVLHSFTGGALGHNPTSGLILGSDGNLYGTTVGVAPGISGCIYRLATDGGAFQVLRTFGTTTFEPKTPRRLVIEGVDGGLYGSSQTGGAFNKGTIFRIEKDGSGFQVLYHFSRSPTDGQTPSAAFSAVGDGSYLGLTEAGGDSGNGTAFRFDPIETYLGIRVTEIAAELTWPASSTSDTVEMTTEEDSFHWQSLNAQTQREAGQLRTTIPRNQNRAFFRIRREWQ
jgi:uncharacterized repeat protein (TIGR03803 family)